MLYCKKFRALSAVCKTCSFGVPSTSSFSSTHPRHTSTGMCSIKGEPPHYGQKHLCICANV